MARPALVRRVYCIDEMVTPQLALLDTSFVFEALTPDQPLHGPCAAFLSRMTEAETVLVYNRLLEVELVEAAYRAWFEAHWGKKWRARRYDGRARRPAARRAMQTREAWERVLDNNTSVCVELDEVASKTPMFMSDYGLGSYDAVHAATALEMGCDEMVTLDASFAKVPWLSLHVDASRIHRCRKTRGGHSLP